MSIPTGEIAGDDLFAPATVAVDDLYRFRYNYFPLNPEERVSKLQSQSDLALQILDTIPIEKRKLPLQRATYEYLRGKILDVVPVYKKEAEDHLSKAVKLNPSLVDAWLCLGNCVWKKGDLNAAKNCFTFALSKGPNKNILCQLSMLERKLAQDAENPEEIVNDSIKHASEAITLDVKEGYSWLSHSYKRATMDLLSEGLNKGIAIAGKVLFFAKNESLAPLYYVLSDSNHTSYVITVYGIRNDAIKEGDQVTLLEPFYRSVDFSWKGKHYQFKSVRVDFVEQVLVNGKCLSPHHAV